jgi:hypothetical protein
LAQLALIEPHVAAGDAATLNRTALAVGRKYTGKVRVRPAHRVRSLPAVAPTAPPHASGARRLREWRPPAAGDDGPAERV